MRVFIMLYICDIGTCSRCRFDNLKKKNLTHLCPSTKANVWTKKTSIEVNSFPTITARINTRKSMWRREPVCLILVREFVRCRHTDIVNARHNDCTRRDVSTLSIGHDLNFKFSRSVESLIDVCAYFACPRFTVLRVIVSNAFSNVEPTR